ncbi:MAG: ABC transporter ATP-binding protein [bacterium]|nr:ABC transporter ATP-binding protein [bacterium]MDE0352400.1 ABC transporter ATP-binding protein [bacterium]
MTDGSGQHFQPAILLEGVTKRFGSVVAVDNVTLAVEEGEFFSLLGPSGCGKTTLLRMLAGFETPDDGSVYLRGEDVTLVQPNKRATNMVFQNYELFPHMTVFNNVAYGLKLKKVPRNEIEQRVNEMLEVVGVGGLGARAADQLSGGQQQRVALARALINRPAVLLLDEPLSALDVKLRKRMQLELKSIQHSLGTTFVYVTHDQEEALLMSDRVGIMDHGRLLQIGAPRSIYEQPRNEFVADFVGTLNDFAVTVTRTDGDLAVAENGDGDRIVVMAGHSCRAGDTLRIAVRPERILVTPRAEEADSSQLGNRLLGRVQDVIYMGPFTQYLVDTGMLGRVVSQRVSNEEATLITPGLEVAVTWGVDAAFPLSDRDPVEAPTT